MIKIIIDEIINILELENTLCNIESLMKLKMYKSLDTKKEDIIKMGKIVMNANKDLYKNSKISKKLGNILKLMKNKKKIEDKWEIDTINNTHNIITDQLYYLKIVSKISNYMPKRFLNNKIKKIFGGETHTFIVLKDNTIFCNGNNGFGQLGLNRSTSDNNNNFWINFSNQNLELSNKIKKIECGYAYTMFLTNDGNVYSCGAGENGRLGLNSKVDISRPQLINFQKKNIKIIDIQCGSTMSIFLSSDFEVYSCGQKFYNGISYEDILVPRKINIPEKIISISVGNGGYHTTALTFNGEIYVWGHNRVCQLGINNEKIFYMCDSIDYIYLGSDNEVIKNEKGLTILIKPIKIELPFLVKKISSAWGHTLILSFENKIYCSGRGNEKQLGIPLTELKIKKSGDHDGGDRYYLDEFTEIPFFKNLNVLDISTSKCTNIVKTTCGIYIFGDGYDGIKQILHEYDINKVQLCNMENVEFISILE